MSNTAALIERIRARRGLPEPVTRRAIRQRAGVSQGDIARAIGVTRQAVGRWEDGTATPRGEHLALYLELLRAMEPAE